MSTPAFYLWRVTALGLLVAAAVWFLVAVLCVCTILLAPLGQWLARLAAGTGVLGIYFWRKATR